MSILCTLFIITRSIYSFNPGWANYSPWAGFGPSTHL